MVRRSRARFREGGRHSWTDTRRDTPDKAAGVPTASVPQRPSSRPSSCGGIPGTGGASWAYVPDGGMSLRRLSSESRPAETTSLPERPALNPHRAG